MKDLVFMINSIGSGGAESALFNIIKGAPFDENKDIRIHLVLLDNEEQLKKVPEGVTLHVLDAKRSLLKSILQSYRLLKTIKPDIVVSFLVRANMVNSCLRKIGLYPASIVCERMHLSSHLRFQLSGFKARIANYLPGLLYKYNDKVLGVSEGVSADLIEHYSVPRETTSTIYNPYDIELLSSRAKQIPANDSIYPEHFIVSVGRLTKSKDQATLIKGFAQANTTRSLVIIGMGDLQETLLQLAINEGVQDRVYFTGYLENPHALMSKAAFFISSSRNEGFPNALLESMVLSKPIVFTSCDSGPAEILGKSHDFKARSMTECKYGLLVPEESISEVSKAIEFFEDNNMIKKYAALSQIRAQDFTLAKISQQYWDEIMRLCQ